MLGEGASPEAIASLRVELGLDQPVPVQFATWLGRSLGGDLGRSAITGEPVGALILSRFQLTAVVVLISVTVATLVAVTFGLLAAWRQNSRLDLAVLGAASRSEEHTSELQSLMRTSYAVFCLKNKTIQH